ncbi:MAG TPA: hypothetical protein DDZ91_06900 [Firmicutes bacterium]|jgi:hypothetical protein|nr:hypothetical protein [Bacillota bacterium]
MFGWYLVVVVISLFLFWRGKKRFSMMLSELSSRVAQVEELLLEVCSVLEEKEPLPEIVLPSESTQQVEEEEDNSFEPLRRAEINLADDGKNVIGSETIEPEVISAKETQEKNTSFEKPETSDSTITTFLHENQIKKNRFETIDLSSLPERNQMIIELFQKGLSVKEIARKSGMGQGEVQLIIDLYTQK